jgi:hypothetical protein
MKIREKLAMAQHDIWVSWMKYLFSVCVENQDGSYTIPSDKVDRWNRQINTHYSALTEIEQQSDLQQADKILSVINQHTISLD